MAAIGHREAERYLDRPDRDHFLFLVYGPDQGLTVERARRLLADDGGDGPQRHIVDLLGEDIATDSLRLVDEANSIGLFEGPRRALRVALGAKSILPALELIERAPPSDCVIVLMAGDLKRDAPLRKWVEQRPLAAAIECALDDARDIQRLLDMELKRANLSIEPEAREILSDSLGDDRLSTRSEIEKLLLYARGQSTVTVQQINDLLLDATAVDLDALMSATFGGRPEAIVELTAKVSFADIDANRLFATALRYALAFQRARGEIESGGSRDDGFQILLRLINGFRRKDQVSKELQIAKLDKTTDFIGALYDALKDTRRKNILADERFARLILALALFNRGGRRA